MSEKTKKDIIKVTRVITEAGDTYFYLPSRFKGKLIIVHEGPEGGADANYQDTNRELFKGPLELNYVSEKMNILERILNHNSTHFLSHKGGS